jgi:solute carrier family 35 protein F1/2
MFHCLSLSCLLQICGATMLNLSLLTSDMWAVLIRIFAYHEKVDWIYFVAFAGTAAGLLIYSYKYALSCQLLHPDMPA